MAFPPTCRAPYSQFYAPFQAPSRPFSGGNEAPPPGLRLQGRRTPRWPSAIGSDRNGRSYAILRATSGGGGRGGVEMSIEFCIAVYFTIWWTTLFAVLPLGVRSHAEMGIPVPGGGDPGSPVEPKLK